MKNTGCRGGKRKTRKTRNTRSGYNRMRGGMYGFGGNVIAPGTLESSAAYSGAVNSSGAPIPDPALQGTPTEGSYTGIGGRRRRRTTRRRKTGSKEQRARTRSERLMKELASYKMKGGASQVSMGGVGYGYAGTGSAGLADATQYVKPGNAY